MRDITAPSSVNKLRSCSLLSIQKHISDLLRRNDIGMIATTWRLQVKNHIRVQYTRLNLQNNELEVDLAEYSNSWVRWNMI